MSIFDNLREGIFKIRVVPKNTAQSNTSFTDDKNALTTKLNDAIESGKRVDLSELQNMTVLKGDRNTRYSAYEEMVADGRIGAAVEMYANDTVQYDANGRVIWVESENTDIANYCNKLLDDLNIAQNLWSYAYCMWLYGDVYLETFDNTSVDGNKPSLLVEPLKMNPSVRTQTKIKGSKLERYIEKVANPAEVYDLQYRGKTSGYIRLQGDDIQSNQKNNVYVYSNMTADVNILNPTKFVHICLAPNINRFPEKFRLIKEDVNQTDEKGRMDLTNDIGSADGLSYTVKTGQSVLENVYSAYQTLKLKEDSVLLERVTKSSITRIIQVELGDMPESKKRQKLQAIKNQIEQQLIMNKDSGSIQSRAGAQPIENIIYTATRQGKGAISTVNIGGDVDMGNLADLEDSENKLYGALLIPKGLLGANMEGCLAGDTMLVLLDGEYIKIKDLVENIEKYKNKGIMSCNEDGELVPTKIKDGKLTRKNALLVRVHLDNDTFIDCTPDHLFMLRNGEFKEAQDLVQDDSLMPYYQIIKNNRRYVLDNKTGVIIPEYRLVATKKYGKLDKKYYQVHHVDENKANDDFDNLIYIPASEHLNIHRDQVHKINAENWKHKKETMTEEEYHQEIEPYIKATQKGNQTRKQCWNENPELREVFRKNLSNNMKNYIQTNYEEWHKKHQKYLWTTENNPMNDQNLREKMRQIQFKKYKTDENYYNTTCESIEKGRKVHNASCKATRDKLTRNCRCIKCGKIFKKVLNDKDYQAYLNKEKIITCSQECSFKTPCNVKISNSLKLYKASNYDLEQYTINKYSNKFGRPDKYSNVENLLKILDMIDKFEPEVKNHKVKNIEWLEKTQDTYDIEVENKSHTFVLANGIFVHNSGLSNGGSLTEMNTTYARRIKRGQIALQQGIKDLINIFAISERNVDVVNNFTIKLTPIITIEDTRRDELLQNKIRNVNDMLSLLNGLTNIDDDVKMKMLINWLSKYLNQQDIVDILNERINEIEQQENEQATDKAEGEEVEEIEPHEKSKIFNRLSGNSDITVNNNIPSESQETLSVDNISQTSNNAEIQSDINRVSNTTPSDIDIANISGEDIT